MNRSHVTRVAALCGGAGVLALAASAGVRAQAPGAPVDAAAGKVAYEANCASCHGGKLEGGQFGPPLTGAAFNDRWGRLPNADLVAFMAARMPPSSPGSLGAGAYGNIAGYLHGGASGGASASSEPRPAPSDSGRGADAFPAPTGPKDKDPGLEGRLAERRAVLDKITPVTDQMLRTPVASEWLMWRRTYDSAGFSPLTQINKANAERLRSAWSWTLPISQNEITPLVHDGVLFLTSGNAVQALNAETGDFLWQYVRPLPDEFVNGRSSRVKGIAIAGENLFVPTADGHLVALNVHTGAVVWDHEVLAPEIASSKGQAEGVALHMDGGPIVARGKVIIGVSLGTDKARGGCFIVALDAGNGHEAWRFYTIARPGQPGGDSWNGAPVEERFGAGVWTAGSYDPELNAVFFGTGNTYDTATLLEPKPRKGESNDGLYTDSTLALDADTGALKWHYQHVKRDVWDLDWVFEQSLVDLTIGGKKRSLVVTAGKIAMFDAMDRATGRWVFSKDLGLQNLVVGVDPATGEKQINPAVQPEAGKAKFVCPSGFGARNWPATSFNHTSKIIYLGANENCSDYTYSPRSAAETAAGGGDSRSRFRLRPEADGKFGRIEALNLETGRIVWSRRQRAPMASSMLATAGGLLFNGDRDRFFRAYDADTGSIIWETRLNATPNATPITYSVHGQQYVAIVAGGGGPFDAGSSLLASEIYNPVGGTTLHVFKLPAAQARRK